MVSSLIASLFDHRRLIAYMHGIYFVISVYTEPAKGFLSFDFICLFYSTFCIKFPTKRKKKKKKRKKEPVYKIQTSNVCSFC